LDRNGEVLAAYTDGGWTYNSSSSVRRATLHAVGDPQGTIGTGALSQFADKLTGYNLITGANTIFSGGRDVYLTLDADICAAAYEGLNGHNGTVGVYNYKTGEIICMVSAPGYDPTKSVDPDDPSNEGVLVNRLIQGKFIPGSTFKLITAAAALENISNIENRTFECTGTLDADGYHLTCPKAHGTMTFEEALNKSCNCTFGSLAVELGSKKMQEYAESTGLTSRYSINGINTTASTFDFEANDNEGLAWSGIGQGQDQVNPASMMIFVGAVANGGKAAVPQIFRYSAFHEGVRTSLYIKHYTDELINKSTASKLSSMMRTDVINNYGQDNFPGLEICAKSGTAQVDNSSEDNAWFTGFLDDDDHPLAFIVNVEGGGYGAKTAGKLANTVLQKAVEKGY
jgi:peptidoglycan glycosyltransferase